MKKSFYIAAVAALVLSSCSSTEEVIDSPVVAENAISFDIFTPRTVSRAISTEELTEAQRQQMTDETLKLSEGFGVFAYNTDQMDFLPYVGNNTYPNFMYDQQVQWDDSKWVYSPVKYWPNEKGDKVTFQAFAPYQYCVSTETSPHTHVIKKVAENAIFSAKYNGVGIRYNVKDAYDLMWGQNYTPAAGADPEKDLGKCVVDKTKPAVSETMKFKFTHSLAKIDVAVSYYVDGDDHTPAASGTHDNVMDANTKIIIRSVKLIGQMPTQGVLSLYNGKWTIEQANEGAYVFQTADFAKNAKKYDNTENAAPIAGELSATNAAYLESNTSWMALPWTGEAADVAGHTVAVQITYDVITTDGTEGHNSSTVTNVITSTDTNAEHVGDTKFSNGLISFKEGTWTKLNIHIGLRAAQFNATVTDWKVPEGTDVNVDATKNTPAS